jgi:N-dimethylarginine dimethylaminohydrolase
MNSTSHSEYLKLKSVYLYPVKNAFVSDEYISQQWHELNYLSPPNFDLAIEEYRVFERLFQNSHIDVLQIVPSDDVMMDALYCRDASIATDYGMIICNMGKEGRNPEPAMHKNEYLSKNELILGVIKSPGTLEGGDVAWLDKKTLAVGHTYRTNQEGILQLKKLLEPKGIEVLVADLPHYKGKQDVFHLMSILSPVDKDLAVVYSPLMPIKFRNELLSRGFELVEVPDEEFESMGCNVLAIAARECIMVEGNPITKERMENAGCQVQTYRGQEISVKGGGGPTCLTRPLLREY